MTDLTGGNQPGRLDIQEANVLLQDKVKAQDAEIRELKAVLHEIVGELDPEIDWVHGEQDGEGSWRVFGAEVCAEASEMPDFVQWLCKRNGWPNPLEGGSDE